MIAIENQNYIVELTVDGAQIQSFKDKMLDIEYMWNGDKTHWGYRSPTLFPIIGSSYDGRYHFNGQTTKMENHGILRSAQFLMLKNTKDQATLQFVSNSETLERFPFYFKILITYTLRENELLVEYEIFNEGVIDMPFNFGLHPAFNVPITADKKFEDYKLEFSSPTKLKGSGPRVNEGLISEVDLDFDLFKKYGTIIYHNVNSPYVSLTDGEHGVRISTVGFPIFSVWSPSEKQAPFICLEPWLGLGKKVEKDLPFNKRDAIMKIGPGQKRLFTYSIKVF
ncbi:MAG TPA: hypothetical protein VFC83_00750 [Erysipelotrichaceae bacterium]|nr:hypothetical protein [Erysipelotrichaceae bacterium]